MEANKSCYGLLDKDLHSSSKKIVMRRVRHLDEVDNDFHGIMVDPTLCKLLSSDCPDLQVKALTDGGKVSTPYLISSRDVEIVAKVSKFERAAAYRSDNPDVIRSQGNCFNSKTYKPGSSNLGLDEFTSETIVAYAVEEALDSSGMTANGHDLAVKYFYSGVCNKVGINLMEYCELGTLRDLATSRSTMEYRDYYTINDPIIKKQTTTSAVKPEIVRAIFSQVVAVMHALAQEISFSSGDLKLENVLVTAKPVKGTYMSLDLSSPIKCKISDFGKSSCRIRRHDGTSLHIYNYNRAADLYLRASPFTPKVKMDNSGVYYYVVDSMFTSKTSAQMRHAGAEYYGSFDYYTFLFTVLSIPEYYYTFFSTKSLVDKFWSIAWLTEEEDVKAQIDVHRRMLQGKRVGLNDAIEMLRGRRLICGLLDRIVR
jgi:serine/threonine protein kinase